LVKQPLYVWGDNLQSKAASLCPVDIKEAAYFCSHTMLGGYQNNIANVSQIHPELPPKYEAAIAGMEITIIAIILV